MGNHDALITWHFAVTPAYNAIATGSAVYRSSEDDYENIPSAGTKVIQDIKKDTPRTCRLYAGIFTTTTLPIGHGFTATNVSRGYRQVETLSLINYPQQARIIEVVDNGNGKVSFSRLWSITIHQMVLCLLSQGHFP